MAILIDNQIDINKHGLNLLLVSVSSFQRL